jgi:hypothetical protein
VRQGPQRVSRDLSVLVVSLEIQHTTTPIAAFAPVDRPPFFAAGAGVDVDADADLLVVDEVDVDVEEEDELVLEVQRPKTEQSLDW